MGMMDKMMNRMIGSMSVEEKEAMMLKMMPLMMKDVDMLKMMPKMMPTLGRELNLTGIAAFIGKVVKDRELREFLDGLAEKAPGVSRKIHGVMSGMRPAMTAMMSGMMDFMAGRIMPVMMPVMSEIMPVMMKEKMPEIVAGQENIRRFMPKMMMEVMPHCVENFSPLMADRDRDEFFDRLNQSMTEADNAGSAGTESKIQE